jgi:Transposase DDE domain
LPFKLNADRRHHIPKQKHKVLNWREYDASLRQRGSLTVWVTDEAIAAWQAEPRTTRGGQRIYSPLAILTALTLLGWTAPRHLVPRFGCQHPNLKDRPHEP